MHAVAQLVDALRNKPAGHGFDFRSCHWKGGLCVVLTLLPVVLESETLNLLETPGPIRACTEIGLAFLLYIDNVYRQRTKPHNRPNRKDLAIDL